MVQVVRIQSRICVGGPALHTILLTEGLSHAAGSRYDTVLFGGALEPGESSMDAFAAARGVKLRSVPEMRRSVSPRRDLAALARMTSLIRTHRPAIVHTHTAKAGAIGRPAARLAGVPVVVHTFHGHVFDGYFDGPKAAAFVAVERGLARLSDCIVAISEQQREELVHRYRIAPAEKIRVIPLGLDLDRFRLVSDDDRGALRAELGVGARERLIVTAGRIVPIKRFDVLVDAFLRLGDPSAHLVIAGDGDAELRRALEQRARPAGSRVHFLGLRRDLHRLYADADVFALTSDNEGTPVAAIEALASGVPVVATDVGGMRDLLPQGAGILAPRGDPAAIAAGLATALARTERLPEAVRVAIVDRYTHHRLIRDVTALYDDLLERARVRSRAFWRVPEESAC
jgi:glycosyltransferase involved in cell wall biosynthesis